MSFNRECILYRGRVITCRYDNIKAPNLRPQLRIQYLDEFKCDYGPFQLTFDLYNMQDPKASKPLAFANLTFEQLLLLGQEIIKAILVAYPRYKPADVAHLMAERVHPWWVRNISKIDRRVLVEG